MHNINLVLWPLNLFHLNIEVCIHVMMQNVHSEVGPNSIVSATFFLSLGV